MGRSQMLILFLILAIPFAAYGQRRSRTPARNNVDEAIRRIDFRNYTYHPSVCNREYQIGDSVDVRNGKFANDHGEFYIEKILYADLTADGHEEAVVDTTCEPEGNNTAHGTEIFIYTLQNGRAVLLAEITDENMRNDYWRYYPINYDTHDGQFGRVIDVKIGQGTLKIEHYSDGPTCCPKHIATLQYRWNGQNFVLSGKPQRRTVKH